MLTVPFFNASAKTPTVAEAYTYGTGGFNDIRADVAIDASDRNGVRLRITYDGTYAGRLLRVDLNY